VSGGGPGRAGQAAALAAVVTVGLLVLGLALAGAGIAGGGLLFAAGQDCTATVATAQPSPSGVTATGPDSIPARYLRLYQETGRRYGISWPLLAGIGKVESDHGRSPLPGVRSGANAFGAAGPMQIGIGGAAGNQWGGAPVHPASEHVNGVAIDANHDGTASVYDPADAIAGAARYLLAHGVLTDPAAAVFAYNHSPAYVQAVFSWARTYARGGYQVTAASTPQCQGGGTGPVPNQVVATVIAYARAQLGKPYQWGATGPDAFDCSGLVMMAYRAAGIDIPRTSQQQWAWGPRIPASQAEPGDLVFFAGSDGTPSAPGHVGLVIGRGLMIEAYAAGFPVRIAPYGGPGAAPGDQHPVGFTRPWQHPGALAAARP
jgi:cell wall-associated NlpC family hydrolase